MTIIYTHRSYICKYMEIMDLPAVSSNITVTVFGSFGACGSAMSGDSFVGLFMKNEPGPWTQIMFRPLGSSFHHSRCPSQKWVIVQTIAHSAHIPVCSISANYRILVFINMLLLMEFVSRLCCLIFTKPVLGATFHSLPHGFVWK